MKLIANNQYKVYLNTEFTSNEMNRKQNNDHKVHVVTVVVTQLTPSSTWNLDINIGLKSKTSETRFDIKIIVNEEHLTKSSLTGS